MVESEMISWYQPLKAMPEMVNQRWSSSSQNKNILTSVMMFVMIFVTISETTSTMTSHDFHHDLGHDLQQDPCHDLHHDLVMTCIMISAMTSVMTCVMTSTMTSTMTSAMTCIMTSVMIPAMTSFFHLPWPLFCCRTWMTWFDRSPGRLWGHWAWKECNSPEWMAVTDRQINTFYKHVPLSE